MINESKLVVIMITCKKKHKPVHVHIIIIILPYFPCFATGKKVCRNDASLSRACSILWGDCEGVVVARAGGVRAEGVVCLCEVVAVSTGYDCWVVLICHIGDEDSVPDVRVHSTHIQRERSTPREHNCILAALHIYVCHSSR